MEVRYEAARKSTKHPTAKNNNNVSIENHTKDDLEKEKQSNKAELLLELVKNEEFFHDEQKRPYVTFKNDTHFETWPLDSKKFREWLSYQFWKAHGKSIHGPALTDAVGVLTGKAIYEGLCHKIFTRVGFSEGMLYVNLADNKWRVVELSQNGWRILNKSPVKFTGSTNMRPLPIPLSGSGNFDLLWKHINISENDQLLVTAWMLDAFMPNSPYPVLMLTGMHGSGKSKTQDRIRELIDPSSSNLRNPPKKSDDISTAAQNNYVVSYNNVSKLSNENQDDLCCLSTGGGFGKRVLFTNGEESVVDTKRPIIMNSICDIITRPDLLDRTICIVLPIINASKRKSEIDLDSAFIKDLPRIFTGLLNLLVKVLSIIPNIKLDEKPRMASFALVGEALAQALNLPDKKFVNIYKCNYQENMLNSLDSSSIAIAVISLMNEEKQFEGTYLELLEKLCWHRSSSVGWPRSPKGLSNALKRLASALKLAGIEINFGEKPRNDGYHIRISKAKDVS
jgi:hypothetical protein